MILTREEKERLVLHLYNHRTPIREIAREAGMSFRDIGRIIDKELKWYKRDDKGDHYLRPFDTKGVGIESWTVTLSLNDIARDLIRDQIIQRKDRFLKALTNNAV